MDVKALDGVRVVEFCDEIGSYCGRLLAELKAEVIKVEPPGGGRQRHTPPYYDDIIGPGSSLPFWIHNTSKKSVVLDLETTVGRESARRLVERAAIVIEDNPPGYLAERGLDYETVSASHPSLTYVSVTGFGQTGPHAGYAYEDLIGQAMSGVMTFIGYTADPPNALYGNQANVCASIHAAEGALIALYHAEATGIGQHVDVSAQEAMSIAQEFAIVGWDLERRNRVRLGGSFPFKIPGANVYRTKDGWCLSLVTAPGGTGFEGLANWMRERGLARDLDTEPFASLARSVDGVLLVQLLAGDQAAMALVPQLDHIDDIVSDFFASMSSREAYEEGQARDVQLAMISKPTDLVTNAQLRARGWFKQVEFDYLGMAMELPGPPYRLSESPAVVRRPPQLGEHTMEVLGAL
jgi:crotonobetainyl-CoA:carnitine CoA-transferase CaiB-like acyl-CoA transferase